MNRRKRWNCFVLAVVLLLQMCCGEMPRSERNMAAEFGMNVNKVYASDQLPADKSKKAAKRMENISGNTESTALPAKTVTPSATETAQTTTPPAVESPSPVPSQPGQTSEPQPTEVVDMRPESVRSIYFCGRGRHKVMVSWKKSEKASYYLVYRRTAGQGQYTQRARVQSAKYLDHSLVSGRKYQYKVIAVNDMDGVRKSDAVTGTYNNNTIVHTGHQKYSYKEMKGDIESLQKKYHGIVKANVIGKSEDGRNIYDVVVGNPKASKTLLVVANLHAREYMTSQLCMDQIEYYLENYYAGESWKKTFDHIAVHYIPMANPDGTTISQYGIKAIRSASLRKKLYKMNHGASTKIWKSNARGVDLNRN